uniref:Hematopoietic cell-specific Lyn substrate 1 n=1 Tax=Amphilophus citrinellus TaxID=61819 RepID=A0A3Q0QXZ5_AMPCI
MWKSVVGHNVNMKVAAEGDDWETDPDFENDVSEQEQRWGAKTIEGSGRKEHISVAELRNKVAEEHEQVKQKEDIPKASYGYGGKFGVEKDRMDKVNKSFLLRKHQSQKDYSKGFGGKFGCLQCLMIINLSYLTAEDNEYEDLSGGQKAIAIYDYEGDDEISFNPDDIIHNIEMIDEGWWKGQCHGRTGLFPAAYVQLIK